MSASAYLSRMGVHEPWIAEIAPSQYAGLSGRGKREYDAKRSREWDASAEAKHEYRVKVAEAYERGKFNEHDADVSSDAKSAIYQYKEMREKEQREQETKSASNKQEAEILKHAQTMTKREFAQWYVEHDPRHVDGFEHVSRNMGNLYWRAVHGEFQNVPHYFNQRIADAKWELKKENDAIAS